MGNEDKAKEKFIRARVGIMKENPFFSMLLLGTKGEFTPEIERIGIDQRGAIYVNPSWFMTLSEDEARTAVAHELGHLVTDSFKRGEGKVPQLWNIASDQAWNELLVKSHFTPISQAHGGWVCREEWYGMTAEEVYDSFPQGQSGGNQGSGSGSGGSQGSGAESGKSQGSDAESFDEVLTIDENGNVRDSRGHVVGKATDGQGNPVNGRAERDRLREEWRRRVVEAQVASKMEGKNPLGADRFVDDLFTPRWSARAILEKYLNYDLSEQNWQYADKKRSGEVIFPAERQESLTVGLAIDTSGSMTEDEIALCKGAVKHIFSICEEVQVEVVECDAERQDTYLVTRHTLPKFLAKREFKGGGGTDYRPVIEHFNRKHPKVLLYATDLFCSSFGEKPSYDVIWLKVDGGANDKPPYGKVIELRR